ncbi:MAG: SpoIVB peptidase S55 domain-containing protein [Thermoanaerobaculaceae bacterium]|nr:SpoIVB peptidase S55 domain-containing protein [Thermoanaerobaculaceae bacterium]
MVPLLLHFALASALAWLDPAAVRPGQQGVCVTEWTGGERREIPVVVMGTLDAAGPDQSAVLVRIDDPKLAGTGVVAGMSGSPVYVDGKLLGAVAFGWPWAQEPLAGVTPFASMRAIPLAGETVRAPAPTLAELAAVAGGGVSLRAVLPTLPDRHGLAQPLFAVAGLPVPPGPAGEPFAGAGIQPVPSGTLAALAGPPEAGDMVAVELVWGDASLAAAGTVTARDGDRVWAFGHPLYGLGTVRFPIARARVLAIQGSYQSPFKVFAVGDQFGTLVADRRAGVVALVGAPPKGTAVKVRVGDAAGEKTWHFAIVDTPILQPLLVTFLANACLTARGAAVGDSSVRLALSVHTADGREVSVRQAARGPDALARLSVFAGAVVSFLANSPFPHPAVSAVDLAMVREEEPVGAAIAEAIPDRATVFPGEELGVDVRLQPYDKPVERRRVVIRVPASAAPGPLDLLVADGASWSSYRLRAEGVAPADYAGQLDQVRRLESSATLVAALEAKEPGAAMPGVSQPGLPPSWSATLAAGLGTRALARLATTVLATRRADGPIPLEGFVRVPLTVTVRQEVP